MKAYDLYLDESGNFTEGLDGAGRPPFSSQLAGVLAPQGAFDEKAAEGVLREVFAALDAELPAEVHATDLAGKGPRFDRLVLALCDALDARSGLRAVRLANREGVGFGAVEATYTRMVAELCVRVLEALAREHEGDVGLRLVGARYMVEGHVQVAEAAYARRLEEHIAYAAIRRGLARESTRMKLLGVRLGSGRRWRELQVCDLLSNASHGDYRKLGADAKARLRATFAPFDWSLAVRDLDRRVDELLEDGAFGLALRTLAEELVGEELSTAAREAAEARLPAVLDGLAALSGPARTPQLAVLDAWLEQLNEHRRDPEMGYRVARWLLERVDAPLRARLGDDAAESLDPFALTLHRHALTASNHRGALGDARDASRAFEALVPRLAGRWEHGPVLIEGLIAQAVHLTDCFEHAEAARRAKSVADYYGELGSLLSVALPDVFPETVRSEQRGKALGTQLQAEMFAGLSDPARFDEARRLNEAAIAELATDADVARQHQYRAQLETYAGQHAAAREHLAKSLGAAPTHAALAEAIAALPTFPQGFALLHWFRLGAAVLAEGDEAEREAFDDALRRSKLHTSAWCTADRLPYPAHGIRRHQAVIAARQGQPKLAMSVLGRLRRLESAASTHPLMAILEAVAHVEVAALTWGTDARGARRLLSFDDPQRKGAQQMLDAVRPRVEPLPALLRWVDDARTAVGQALAGALDDDARDRLLGCARRVGY